MQFSGIDGNKATDCGSFRRTWLCPEQAQWAALRLCLLLSSLSVSPVAADVRDALAPTK
jgi:hypothetical protein